MDVMEHQEREGNEEDKDIHGCRGVVSGEMGEGAPMDGGWVWLCLSLCILLDGNGTSLDYLH